jgi:hypothetical protein
MLASGGLVHADVVNVQRLDVLQQVVALHLVNLAKGMAQYLPVVVDENGVTVSVEQGFEFLLIVFGGVGLEQVRPYYVMHHVHLVQQFDDASDVVFTCFSNHICLIFVIRLRIYEIIFKLRSFCPQILIKSDKMGESFDGSGIFL